MAKKQKHYVNNADFLAALVKYKDECEKAESENKIQPQVPNYVGECWLKIAEHLSRKPNFIAYSFRDEMISDGIENCMMYFRNFNAEKSNNPFAYFTQIIYYAFLRRITREKKQLYVKYKATEQMGVLDDFEDADGNTKQFELYENISRFIQDFETSKKKKKETKSKGVDKFVEE